MKWRNTLWTDLNLLEEQVTVDVVRQLGEELGDEDEVGLCQERVLVQGEDAQRRPQEEALAIPDQEVPHAARHVQGAAPAVQYSTV